MCEDYTTIQENFYYSHTQLSNIRIILDSCISPVDGVKSNIHSTLALFLALYQFQREISDYLASKCSTMPTSLLLTVSEQ